jgi:DNA-binding transcriptional LysR family regulator
MQINPRLLKYVMTIAEEKSFSRAAEKLFISQPSLSGYILRVEKELGVTFFNRDAIPLTLTYAGERFINVAHEFAALEERLLREIYDITNNKSGRITVGVSSTRGPHIIPKLFEAFKNEYPRVELLLKEGSNENLLKMVNNGRIDFAFVGYADDSLESIQIRNDRVRLAAPIDNPLTQQYVSKGITRINLAKFCDERFILLHKGQSLRNIADRIFADYKITPLIAYETRSFNTAYHMAIAGLGFIFFPSVITPVFSSITLFDFDQSIYSYPLLLAHRKDIYLSKPMQRFIELSKEIPANNSVVYCLTKSE